VKSSLFEVFKVGVGPSSSHTTGPMRAALDFARMLEGKTVDHVEVHLYGSLGLTGEAHGTGRAVLVGLAGHAPDLLDPDEVEPLLARIDRDHALDLNGGRPIQCDPSRHLHWHRRERMPAHPNGLRFVAIDGEGGTVLSQGYYSVGGGTIVREEDMGKSPPSIDLPCPFRTAAELIAVARERGLQIWEVGLENELRFHALHEVHAWLRRIWEVMRDSVRRGLGTDGTLPGGLGLRRRAAALARRLEDDGGDPMAPMDWLDAWAMAASEQNAAGGQVVTAPTNGAAGVLPAVLHYYHRFVAGAGEAGLFRFLLTAAVLGTLFRDNASISGADVGCQGEVGVACSMAAGGLTAALGGDNWQVEKAAEIGMEHNLGLTCDPVAGLVQIPCIERNAMGAVKALNASRIALRESGEHRVSLDQVIRTMLQTGHDMKARYKETSQGGLAVNVRQC
jgi:L-serine dehydratase